ncbi:MAG: hypothetical protein H5T98_07800 [Syntrophomonadaceae bacterium]|nr:hypothetical protein [Syntrophomonadaceae bacterium]
MPNYKIFQDEADRLRVKIYGSENVPLKTDADGSLSVTGIMEITSSDVLAVCQTEAVPISQVSTLGVCQTEAVPISQVDTLSVCQTQAVAISQVDTLSVCQTEAVPISQVDTLAVCQTEAVAISQVADLTVQIADHATTEVEYTVSSYSSTDYASTAQQVVLGQEAWTYTIKNISEAANDAVVEIQMSATAEAESDWLQEVAPVTLNQNSLVFLTSSLLVKYARVYYKAVNASSPVTLSIIYQAQK